MLEIDWDDFRQWNKQSLEDLSMTFLNGLVNRWGHHETCI